MLVAVVRMSAPEASRAYLSGEEPVVRAGTGWHLHISLTGSWLRPFSTAGAAVSAADAIGPASPGPGQISVVVDPDDSIDFARTVGVGWAVSAKTSTTASRMRRRGRVRRRDCPWPRLGWGLGIRHCHFDDAITAIS